MIEEKYIELMHREIDGVCSEGESAQLRGYLKENPEASRYFEELSAIARMFNSVEELEPPAELRENIFSAVFGRARETRERESSASLFDVFRLTFNRKFAYAFTAGLVVGICLFALLFRAAPSRVPGDLDHLYGTLATKERQAQVFTAEPIDFDLPAASGSLQIQYTSDTILATFSLLSESRIRAVFEYPDNLHFEGLRASDNRDYAFNVTGNKAELIHIGNRDYVAVFKGSLETRTAVDMRIFADGSLLFERTILLGRE
ncbi:MAG: hypothetical protein AMJ46_04215 [Latescibacteria bacterium DG_63]|nr:MAG: hypothetical protein AMJ46_04215 [Latescibacteria bacterium DG_63]